MMRGNDLLVPASARDPPAANTSVPGRRGCDIFISVGCWPRSAVGGLGSSFAWREGKTGPILTGSLVAELAPQPKKAVSEVVRYNLLSDIQVACAKTSSIVGLRMKTFHIALTGANDLAEIVRLAANKQRPRHSVPVLARRLGAKLHQTNRDAPPASSGDPPRSRPLGSPVGGAFSPPVGPDLCRKAVVFWLGAGGGGPCDTM